jgi:hypothetical protein
MFIIFWEKKYYIMLGMAITVACLPMGKLGLDKAILWLGMGKIMV